MAGNPPIPRELMQYFNNNVEVQRYFDTLGLNTDEFASKVSAANEDNIIVFSSDGDLKDSGESIDTIMARSYFYGRSY